MQAQRYHAHSRVRRTRLWSLMLGLTALIVLSSVMFPSTAFAGGNDIVNVSLRGDLEAVYLAHDFVSSIYVGGIPPTSGMSDFTTGWFSINLAPGDPWTVGKFTQLGFATDQFGPFWFVYSRAGVTCWQGSTWYGTLGCRGNYYERATIGNWQKVELVTYGPNWIARVYDQYGSALDVAAIPYNSSPTNAIYGSTATSEEVYNESTDPYLLASFRHSHPQYFIGGSGYPFADWPASSNGPGTKRNWLNTTPSGVCPDHYFAILNWLGDPRVWYAGSTTQGPGVCSANKVW